MGQVGLVQRPADKAHVVGGTAAAARLGHDDGQPVGVIPSRQHGLHDLSHHRDGGEAGVVVDVFQAGVDGGAVVVVQHLDFKAVLGKDRL